MTGTRVSIVVTAYREAATVGQALAALINQTDDPITVVCPDDETAAAAARYPSVEVLRDPGRGKPAALNVALEAIDADILVLTDGDVTVAPGALRRLLAPFADEHTGAVSGRPVSISPRDTMLGYWSHLLTDAGAHTERAERDAAGQFFVASGYLYALRPALIDRVPEDALAEDAVLSHLIGRQGYRVRYAPDAEVFVKYPTTYRDWLTQKVRSAGGYAQPIIAESPLRMRSFRHEARAGAVRALRFARSPREMLWTLLLFAARIHLWLLILWRVRIRRRPLTALWRRVETTK